MPKFLPALLALAVAAAAAGSGQPACFASAEHSELGQMPQGLVGHATRPDSQLLRQAKARASSPLSLPCGLLPGTLPVPAPTVGARGVGFSPTVAIVPGSTRSGRTTRGPPASESFAVQS